MRSFVLRLVAQLIDDERPLSRNRHFDTFDDPAGRRALRLSRQLRALEKEILAAHQRDGGARCVAEEREGAVIIRLEWASLAARRTSYLKPDEFRLLLGRPGVRAALQGASEADLASPHDFQSAEPKIG